jgi:hypothetical protein
VRERLRTSCTKDLIGRTWLESLAESKEVGMVEEIGVDVDICTGTDTEIGIIAHSQNQGDFSEKDI